MAAILVSGQVVINEVCSNPLNSLPDEDGQNEDWIELYNLSDEPASMAGWFLSDKASDLEKWPLPGITIAPGGYLLIFASGKNRPQVVDHWESVVYASHIWKYFIPGGEPDPQWNQPLFNDSSWLSGPGGFGRGDGDDLTVLPDSVATVYLRIRFNIMDTSAIYNALMHVDYDDAFVAYLNGTEICRANIGYAGKVHPHDDIAFDIHEAVMFQGLPPEEFRLEPGMLRALLVNGENTLAIQALNAWNNDGNSSIIPFLSLGIKDTTHHYLPIPDWFPQKNFFPHTNFSLSWGDNLFLKDPNGNIADHIQVPSVMMAGHSYGRTTDGGPEKKVLAQPGPGNANSSSTAYPGYHRKPVFSLQGGFYDGPVTVSVLNFQPGDTLRISFDGSPPGDTAALYNGPFTLDSTTVVRATFLSADSLPGFTETNTYFFNENTGLPVVSISLNPYDLWDWDHGMYVMGPNAQPYFPFWGANFWEEWEKSAHIEYFDTMQQQGFEQDLGLQIHGGWSRAYDMKSLRLLPREIYHDPDISYPVFPTKDIGSFKRLVLRNSGQDFNVTHFRDALMHKIAQEKMDVDIQDYQPCIVFLNGEYWGIHNIREKINEDYIEENYGYDADSIDMLSTNIIIIAGKHDHYSHMTDYFLHLPSVDSTAYDSLSSLLDISNFSDYFITEMFYANSDWPNNNIKYWRAQNDTARWRYIFTDLDPGLGLAFNPPQNELYRVLHSNIQWVENHLILRRLLEFPPYKQYFINRSADLFNTALSTNNVLAVMNRLKSCIEPWMPRHLDRWGSSLTQWNTNVQKVINFANLRPGYVRNHYQNEFDLEKQVVISLQTDSTAYGSIRINTIIPDSLPWQGIYYDGNPVTITAIAHDGYAFTHWSADTIFTGIDTLQSTLVFNPDTNISLKAHFIKVLIPEIVFSEICYKSPETADAGDWVEILNADTLDINLEGYFFSDDDPQNEFRIEDSLVLGPGSRLVICQDTALFRSVFPDVMNITGPFGFGLSKNGENLVLREQYKYAVSSVAYHSEPPWPQTGNSGRTLELHDPYGDLNNGTNWFAGCVGGSPGIPYEICDTIGITESNMSYNSRFTIYPNPAKDYADIYAAHPSEGDYHIAMINPEGVVVRFMNRNFTRSGSPQRIETNNLSPGLYMVLITNATAQYKLKIIIQ